MFVGKGGFAKVYLGITEKYGHYERDNVVDFFSRLRSRRFKLAVKKLDPEASRLTATHRDRTFNYEVAELSRLKHPNLIEILGYSNDVAESVCLIYPYFVNGNLEDRLMMKRTPHQQVRKARARLHRRVVDASSHVVFLRSLCNPMLLSQRSMFASA